MHISSKLGGSQKTEEKTSELSLEEWVKENKMKRRACLSKQETLIKTIVERVKKTWYL